MTRFFATAACITAMSLPMAVSAQDVDTSDMSPEMQARFKAAQSSDNSNEGELYINGRRIDAESGSYTTGPDGEVFIRMSPEYDLTPSNEVDEGGMAMSPSEIENECREGDTLDKVGLPCG